MAHTFDIQITPKLFLKGRKAWFFNARRLWPLAGFAVFLRIVPSNPPDNLDTVFHPWTHIPMAIAVLILASYLGVYFLNQKRALSQSTTLLDHPSHCTLSRETFQLKNDAHETSLCWGEIHEVRRDQDLLLFHLPRAHYLPLPVMQIPETALAFLIERARAYGVRVVGL